MADQRRPADGRGRRERRRGSRGGRCAEGCRDRPSTKNTATGAVAAVGAYLANDLRDPEGLARPVLRRAAQTLAASRRSSLQRAGTAYLRLDPPRPLTIEAQSRTSPSPDDEEIIEAEIIETEDSAEERE